MELNGWSSPQMLARYGRSARSARDAVTMTTSWETDAPMAKDINRRIAAEISWARTHDRTARTRPREKRSSKRFEKEVDPDGTLPPEERRQRAEHAKRAYMLQLAKRSADARRLGKPRPRA